MTRWSLEARRWSLEAQKVYFIAARDAAENFYEVPLEGGAERALTDFAGKRVDLEWLQTDGDFLYFSVPEDSGDVWVMDVEQQGAASQ